LGVPKRNMDLKKHVTFDPKKFKRHDEKEMTHLMARGNWWIAVGDPDHQTGLGAKKKGRTPFRRRQASDMQPEINQLNARRQPCNQAALGGDNFGGGYRPSENVTREDVIN